MDIRSSAANNVFLNNNITATTTAIIRIGDYSGNELVYRNSFGEINWTGNLNQSNPGVISLGEVIQITNNSVYVNNTALDEIGLIPANITFTDPNDGDPISPYVYRDGSICDGSFCTSALTSSGNDFSTEVISLVSNYSIGEGCNLNLTTSHNQSTDILNCPDNYIINLSASNIYFDGQGHRINGSGDYGIYATGSSNVTVRNTHVNMTDGQYAIRYYLSDYAVAINNTVETSGANTLTSEISDYGRYDNNTVFAGSFGIVAFVSHYTNWTNNYVDSPDRGIRILQSTDNNVINNTVDSNFFAFQVDFQSHRTLAENNTILTTDVYGVRIATEVGNSTLKNNRIRILNSPTNIITDESNASYLNSLIYENSFGLINFTSGNLTIAGPGDLGLGFNINLTNNSIYINSTNLTGIVGLPANLSFYGLESFTQPIAYRNGGQCTTECSNFDSSNAPNYTFEVTTFSNYSVGEAPVLGCNIGINESTTLYNNIENCTTNYFVNITANNVTLDCNGYLINGTGDYGVFASGLDNITIKNCLINITGNYAVQLTNVDNSYVINNTIIANDSYGLSFTGPTSNLIANNTIEVGNANALAYNDGSADTVTNNTISSGSSFGVRLGSPDNLDFSRNSVTVNGPRALSLISNADNNTFTENTLQATVATLIFESDNVDGNVFINNNITATSSEIIRDNTGGLNTYIYNNSFGQINWSSGSLNVTVSGSIRLGEEILITNNSIYVNETALNDLAITAANVTFFGLDQINSEPVPLVNGSDCNDCGDVSEPSTDTFTFNAPYVYNMSIGNNSLVCNTEITTDTIMRYDILNCVDPYYVNITANNVNFDGRGYIINGTADTALYITGDDVTITNVTLNVTSGDNILRVQNAARTNVTKTIIQADSQVGFYIFNGDDGYYANNIVYDAAGGMTFWSNSDNNIVLHTQLISAISDNAQGYRIASGTNNTFRNVSATLASVAFYNQNNAQNNKFYDVTTNTRYQAANFDANANNNVFYNPNFTIVIDTMITSDSANNNSIIYNNSFGYLNWTGNLSTTTATVSMSLGEEIVIANNSIYVNETALPIMATRPANLTLYSPNTGGATSVNPLRDGELCGPFCSAFDNSSAPDEYLIEVTGFSTYSVGNVCGIDINESTTLTSDIDGCTEEYIINITTDNVVLDCNGYNVKGTSNRGINVLFADNVTIQNCNVNLSGASSERAIYVQTSENTTIFNTTAHAQNSYGLYLATGSGIIINRSSATANTQAVSTSTDNTLFVDSNFTSSTTYGVRMSSANHNIFRRVTIVAGTAYGLNIGTNADNTSIYDSSISADQSTLITAITSDDIYIENTNLSAITSNLIDDDVDTNTTIIFNNSFGSINWTGEDIDITQAGNLTLGGTVLITNNSAYVDTTQLTDLRSTPVNVTIYDPDVTVTSAYPYRSDVLCDAVYCDSITSQNDDYVIQATGFTGAGNYSVGEACNVDISYNHNQSVDILNCNQNYVINITAPGVEFNGNGLMINTSENLAIFTNGTGNVTVRNTVVNLTSSNKYGGIHLEGSSGSQAINNTVSVTGIYAIYLYNITGGVVENNTLITGGDLLHLSNVDYINVTGNAIGGPISTAVRFVDADNSRIINNTIRSNYFAFRITVNSDNNLIENNSIITTYRDAVAFSYSSANNILKNNFISATQTDPLIIHDWTGSGTVNTLIYENAFGKINITSENISIDGPGGFDLDRNLSLTNNSIFVNSTAINNFSIHPANLTFFDPGTFTLPLALLNGSACGARCGAIDSSDAPNYTFEVTGFSNYSIIETPVLGCNVAINESTTLFSNIENCTSDYIINITADNVTLDCNGYLINGTSDFGIFVSGQSNVTVRNCVINLTGTDSDFGIRMTGVTGGFIVNNTVEVNDDSAISYIGSSTNGNIHNNSAYAPNGNVAIGLGGSSINISNNTLQSVFDTVQVVGVSSLDLFNNSITANSRSFRHNGGMFQNSHVRENTLIATSGNTLDFLGTASNNIYRNNYFNSASDISIDATGNAQTLIYNNSFGEINITIPLAFNDSGVLSLGTGVVISNNSIYLNGTAFPNISSQTANLTFVDPDDGIPTSAYPFRSGQLCDGYYCSAITEQGNNYLVELSSFGSADNFSIGDGCNVNIDYDHNQSVDILNCADDYIVNLTTTNIVFNGGGHTIQGTNDTAIYVLFGADGVIVNNVNVMLNGTVSGDNAIYFDGTAGVTLSNSSIDAYGLGVLLTGSDRSTLINNYINSTTDLAVVLNNANNNTVHNNNLTSTGYRPFQITNGDYNNISSNNITSYGNSAVYLTGSHNNSFEDNDVSSYASFTQGYYLINSDYNNFTNERVFSNGSSTDTVTIQGSSHNRFIGGNITSENSVSSPNAILLQTSSTNNLFLNVTLSADDQLWQENSVTSFNQLVYENIFGIINWSGNFNITHAGILGFDSNLNISNNSIYVNSSYHTSVTDIPSNLTLFSPDTGGATAVNPLRNGELCGPFCTDFDNSSAPDEYRIEVTGFSTYSVGNVCGIDINESTTLNEDIAGCTIDYIINITTDNVVLDCNGYTVQSSGSRIVHVSNVDNVTVKNCVLNTSNDYGLSVDNADNSFFINNTIWAGDTRAISETGGSRGTLFANNTAQAVGSFGLSTSGDFNTFTGNNFTAASYGARLGGATDNNLTFNYFSSSNFALELGSNADRNYVANNRISGSNTGLFFTASVDSNIAINNNITAVVGNTIRTEGDSNTIIYNNSFGMINWTGSDLAVTGAASVIFGESIIITNNSIYVNDTELAGIASQPANITLRSPDLTGVDTPYPRYNDSLCSSSRCIDFNDSDAPEYVVQVSGFSNYSLGNATINVSSDLVIVNNSDDHTFNATADIYSAAPIIQITVYDTIGTCTQSNNGTNGFILNVNYSCSGPPLVGNNVTIEFCSAASVCVNTSTVSNPYPNRLSEITSLAFNTTSGFNYTNESLDLYLVANDNDTSDRVFTTVDWKLNGGGITLLNMPFNINVSTDDTGAVRDYSDLQTNATLNTGSAMPIWNSSCQVGGCYEFDGDDDYITVGDIELNDTSSFSVSAWFRHDGGNDQRIVSKDPAGLNPNVLILGVDSSGDLTFSIHNGTDFNSVSNTSYVQDTSWHHVVAVFSSSQLTLYQDGVLSGSSLFSQIGSIQDPNDAPVYIGARSGLVTNAFWNGSIDEVQFFNRSLGADDVSAIYQYGLAGTGEQNLSSSMTSVGDNWSAIVYTTDGYEQGASLATSNITIVNIPTVENVILNATSTLNSTLDDLTLFFDETGSTNVSSVDWRVNGSSYAILNMPFNVRETSTTSGAVRDYTVFGNNATLGGGTGTRVPAFNDSCVVGSCYTFDGTDDYISINDDDALTFGNSSNDTGFSISAWINMSDATQFRIVSKGSETDSVYEYLFGTTASDQLAIRLYATVGSDRIGRDSTSAITSSENNWIHVAMTYDGSGSTSGFNLYQNGALLPSSSAAAGSYTAMANTDTNVTIGRDWEDGGTYADGSIDEILIFNATLSVEQIVELYNAGLQGKSLANISMNETSGGDIWQAAITPSDLQSDGATVLSNTLTVDGSTVSIEVENTFVNYTNAHSFNVTAGVVTSGVIINTSLWASSGSCSYLDNTSIGQYTNVTYNCTGTPFVTSNVTMQFCIGGGICTNSTLSGNDYPNQAPGNVTLIAPTDGNETVHAIRPLFNWTDAVDPEGDVINYTFQISTDIVCQPITPFNVTDSNATVPTDLCPNALEVYRWNVTACDAWNCSNVSATFNFTLEPFVDIVLVDNTVDFGNVNTSDEYNTTSGSPTPFRVRNEGNTVADLVNVSATDSLWDSALAPLDTFYTQIKVRNVTGEEGAFNFTGSLTDFVNLSLSLTSLIDDLNFSDATDEAIIDVGITVPPDEPAGVKSTNVVFSWEETP